VKPTFKTLTHNPLQITSCPHHSTRKLLKALAAMTTGEWLMLIAAAHQQQ
jgi:hypothetical protein